jgi:glyoxylase-like metal-dependent hydrolase (beta-lactamase superfamily II)
VWFLDGPSANPVAIEFKNYVAIVETSTSEEYVLAVIKKVKELVPNKPILYDINSHYHTDHAYGLRTYVAEGATIITSEQNKWFYEDVVLKAPHKLHPDLLAKNPKAAKFIWVKDKYVLTDGDRSLEVYWAKDTAHCASQLISYMPKEKLLIETDLLSGPGNKTLPPPGFVNPYIADLGKTIKRLNLDVQQIAIAHSHGVLPVEWLNKQLVGTVQDAPIQPLY